MKGRRWLWVAVGLLAWTMAGCALLPGTEGETTTPSPESSGNQVVYAAPYRAVLGEGEGVPGASLEYVGQEESQIHVRIDGEDAYKKIGDSFNWLGSPAAGVDLHFKLRVMGVYVEVFQAWGEVEIIVSDPAPAVADLPESAPLVYHAAIASYTVAKGDIVPGTAYTYLGKTEKGAEFGGLDGYAFREVADSLDWSGRVRENVYVDLTMRVRSIEEDEVSLIGTATVWIQ